MVFDYIHMMGLAGNTEWSQTTAIGACPEVTSDSESSDDEPIQQARSASTDSSIIDILSPQNPAPVKDSVANSTLTEREFLTTPAHRLSTASDDSIIDLVIRHNENAQHQPAATPSLVTSKVCGLFVFLI